MSKKCSIGWKSFARTCSLTNHHLLANYHRVKSTSAHHTPSPRPADARGLGHVLVIEIILFPVKRKRCWPSIVGLSYLNTMLWKGLDTSPDSWIGCLKFNDFFREKQAEIEEVNLKKFSPQWQIIINDTIVMLPSITRAKPEDNTTGHQFLFEKCKWNQMDALIFKSWFISGHLSEIPSFQLLDGGSPPLGFSFWKHPNTGRTNSP